MKISKTGSTLKQVAYARRIWGGQGESKKQVALDVGYSTYSSNSCVSKIENKKGFNNAMAALAAESNNVAMSVLHEFKSRGVQDFSNKDLVGALNAIAGAWDRFNKGLIQQQKPVDNGKNRLRTIMLKQVGDVKDVEVKETQPPASIPETPKEELDF